MARQMKDSGVEWIGEIPADWEVSKIKYISQFEPRCDTSNLKDTDIISYAPMECVKNCYYERKTASFGLLATSLTPFCNGDIVMAKVTPCFENGNITIMDNLECGFGLGSSELFVFRPTNIDTKFMLYWLQNKDFVARACSTMTGTGGLKRVSPQFVRNCEIHYPPISEQHRIADFLDTQCARIDSVLEETRSSIEEYKKLKQAVITQAVTKGVRGDRPMKDSGIEWIGEIPADWKTTQLRHCASVKSGITLGKLYPKDTLLVERPYLRVANVQDGYVDTSDVATLQVTAEEDVKYRLHAGDVLMTEGGDRDKLGRGCVWNGEISPCLHQNHIFAVKTNENLLNPYYLERLTMSQIGRIYFDVTAIKTTNLACTNASKVLSFIITLPSIQEQNEIVAYLNEKCSAIDTLIAKKEQSITELENYKKSLIYEYVTGKKEI